MFYGKKKKRKSKNDVSIGQVNSDGHDINDNMRKIMLPDDSTNLGYWLFVNTDYFVQGNNNKKAKKNFIIWLVYTYIITFAQALVIKTIVDSFIEDLLESY